MKNMNLISHRMYYSSHLPAAAAFGFHAFEMMQKIDGTWGMMGEGGSAPPFLVKFQFKVIKSTEWNSYQKLSPSSTTSLQTKLYLWNHPHPTHPLEISWSAHTNAKKWIRILRYTPISIIGVVLLLGTTFNWITCKYNRMLLNTPLFVN